jgi:hypothetical protein
MKTFKIPFTKGAKGLLWLPNEGIQVMSMSLSMKVYHGRYNKVEDCGIISRKMVTTEGVNLIRDAMAGAAPWEAGNLANPVFGLGTSTAQTEATTDTYAGKWVGGSPIQAFDATKNTLFAITAYPTSFVVPTVSTGTKTLILESNFDFANSIAPPLTVTENFFCFAVNTYHTIITALFDRSLLSQPVTSSDKIKFTYTLTFTDGG